MTKNVFRLNLSYDADMDVQYPEEMMSVVAHEFAKVNRLLPDTTFSSVSFVIRLFLWKQLDVTLRMRWGLRDF